jgi:hypothetical protein
MICLPVGGLKKLKAMLLYSFIFIIAKRLYRAVFCDTKMEKEAHDAANAANADAIPTDLCVLAIPAV